MNYTKLTINGVDYGLKFGMVSDRYLSEKLQGKYCFNGEDITEIGIAHILYAGHLNNCAIKDESPTLTFESLVDFIESSLNDEEQMLKIGAAIKVWSDVQVSRQVTETDKKKQSTKKSKS